MLVKVLALTLAAAVPAFADPGPSGRSRGLAVVPDLGSAVPVPSNPDYEVTDDGFLVFEGDIVFECESLRYEDDTLRFEKPENRAEARRRAEEAHEERVEICTEAGFPPSSTLPETGGPRPLLAPVALLACAGLLVRAIAAPREKGP